MQTVTAKPKIEEITRPEGSHTYVLRFNNMPAIQLLNGNRFIVSSPDGDISVIDHGFYRDDTRMLSSLTTRVNGTPLTPLNSNYSTPSAAEFYLTNPELKLPGGGTIPKESLVIARHRLIDRFVQEDFYVFNVSLKPVKASLSFEMDTDFLDLFEVKEKVFADKPDMGKNAAVQIEPPRPVKREFFDMENAFNFTWTDEKTGFAAQTVVWFSEKGVVKDNKITFDLNLAPSGGNFHVVMGIAPFLGDERRKPGEITREQISERAVLNYREKMESAKASWRLHVPQLQTRWDELRHSYYQSLIGLIALQITDPSGQGKWTLPAAGSPWFMTLFGR
ncbi:MAG: glycogen debranching N-terminal domain-containing protein, partial [Nitrososphaerales archaeon]